MIRRQIAQFLEISGEVAVDLRRLSVNNFRAAFRADEYVAENR
jgi:hypothetical protein